MSKLISIGEITTYKKGYAFKSKDYSSEGIPIVKVSDFDDHTVSTSSTKLKQEASDGFEDWKLQKNDVLIASVGSWATNPNSVVGKVVKVNGSLTDALLNQNCVRLRVKEGFDQEYLFYCLKNKNFSNHCIASAQGSANQASIKLDDIHAFMIPNFSLKEQQKISSLLSCLDKKIELNQEINKTLEEIAKTLFKSWFIDFDPVKAKAEGRPTGLSKEISDLFPDSFEDSELGEIPKGWKIDKLGSHINLTKGKSYRSEELKESDTALVTLKSFQRNGGYREDGLKEYTGSFKDEQIVSDGDLIVAFTDVTQAADVIGKPAIVIGNPNYSKLVISLDVGVIRVLSESMLTNAYIYFLMLSNRYASNSLRYTNGTNVLYLKKEAITEYDFCITSNTSLLEIYNDISGNMLEKISKNSLENITLKKLRHTLLPRLISGELQIKDAENFIEEAGI